MDKNSRNFVFKLFFFLTFSFQIHDLVGSSTGRRGLDQPDHVHRLLRRLLGPHLLPLPHRGRQEAGRKDSGITLRSRPAHHPGFNYYEHKILWLEL